MSSDMQEFNAKIITAFRANKGAVGAPFEGAPLMLLGTTGAKSGAARTNPLAYVEDGDRMVIIASFAGAVNNPPWYHNLVANPEVTVEVGEDKYQAKATVLGEPERTTFYDKMVVTLPVFAEYKEKTPRVIPVIALEKV